MNKDNIVINDKTYLPKFDLDIKTVLNKSMVLYGSRGSGKSIICKDIMYLLKDRIPTGIVFNATERSNSFFSNIISKPFLYNQLNIDILNNVWKRQEQITAIHEKVNNINALLSIIQKLNLTQAIEAYYNITKTKEKYADELQKNIDSDNKFLIEMNKLNDKFDELKLLTLKKIIISVKKRIKNNELPAVHNLNKDDIDIIKFIDINPNILLIFDDCAAELKKYSKTDTLRKLFYQSRHVNITFIITAQDEIDLDASLRKNANITILCDSNCCLGFFERSSNSFGKSIRQIGRDISEKIYNDKKNVKLVYNKDSDVKLQWYIATIREDFVFGSKYNLEYAKKIVKDEERDISMIIENIYNH